LLPTGRSCEDSWVIASALVPLTQRLRFLVAARPGLSEPSMTARMAATLDRLSDGRVVIDVVAGGDPDEMHGDGVWFDQGQHYIATAECLAVWRRLMRARRRDIGNPAIDAPRQTNLDCRACLKTTRSIDNIALLTMLCRDIKPIESSVVASAPGRRQAHGAIASRCRP
jgi:alkanesulfonate monooxygenase SsuD/methylene tetrahydromethanopterin reductase-like flavin-dependent oxidoreductase (luciferase family)